jgi:antirestriction protein
MSPDQEVGPRHETVPDNGPRIYIASLSDYNAGILHGVWLPAADEPEAIQGRISSMLADSPTTRRYGEPAEEWAIHDYEGFGSFVHLGEYEPLAQVAALARGIVAHGEAFAAWWAMDPPDETDDDHLEGNFEEHFLGEYGSVVEFAEQMLEDLGVDVDDLPDVPEAIRPYIQVDVEAYARDLQYGGDISTVDNEKGVYVFWNV